MTIAGIVLYNPDLIRLDENITAIIDQVDKVLLVDNGSGNFDAISEAYDKESKIEIIPFHENRGIGRALNEIVRYGHELGCEWVLTLDQDSVCLEGIIEHYLESVEAGLGMMTCFYDDRNYKRSEDNWVEGYVDKCVTSCAFTNVEACYAVGGFDESMFIDMIDTDMCKMMIEHGYKIKKIAFRGMIHELGENTHVMHPLGRPVLVSNHNTVRRYYIARNNIYFLRKHRETISNMRAAKMAFYKDVLIAIIYEKQKIKKFLCIIKGIKAGRKMSVEHIDYLK